MNVVLLFILRKSIIAEKCVRIYIKIEFNIFTQVNMRMNVVFAIIPIVQWLSCIIPGRDNSRRLCSKYCWNTARVVGVGTCRLNVDFLVYSNTVD